MEDFKDFINSKLGNKIGGILIVSGIAVGLSLYAYNMYLSIQLQKKQIQNINNN